MTANSNHDGVKPPETGAQNATDIRTASPSELEVGPKAKKCKIICIFIDADACPVREEVYKVAYRLDVPVRVVANSYMRIPRHELITIHVVDDHMDAADDFIAERAHELSVVVTADIPLADRCIKAGAIVLAPNGKPFTQDMIGNALATRALMADLRSGATGDNLGGPKAFTSADRSRFLSSLDEAVNRLKRERG